MNHHFGKFADVWKHLVLTELLTREPPKRYAETHAGSASYDLIDDAERRFGVLRFVAEEEPALAQSPYRQRIEPSVRAGSYPGSAAIAMLTLPRDTSYLLCDLDPHSAADLRSWAAEHELTDCRVVEQDGMAATLDWVDTSAPTVVHIDPFDPESRSNGGHSAVELAIELIGRGVTVAYWYGYDEPARRGWAFRRMSDAGDVWCGDMMVVDANAEGTSGDLGEATTPGTGSGMLLAHVGAETAAACHQLGEALADSYAGARLPDGSSGGLDFVEYVNR